MRQLFDRRLKRGLKITYICTYARQNMLFIVINIWKYAWINLVQTSVNRFYKGALIHSAWTSDRDRTSDPGPSYCCEMTHWNWPNVNYSQAMLIIHVIDWLIIAFDQKPFRNFLGHLYYFRYRHFYCSSIIEILLDVQRLYVQTSYAWRLWNVRLFSSHETHDFSEMYTSNAISFPCSG